MIKAPLLLALATGATAASLVPASAKPLLTLRGGAYPPPKTGYHMLATKGSAATKMEPLPNLLSGALAGG